MTKQRSRAMFNLPTSIPAVRIAAAHSLPFVPADIPAARSLKTEFSLANGAKAKDGSALITVKQLLPERTYKQALCLFFVYSGADLELFRS